MDPLQRLLSLGLVQGATTAASADQVRLSVDGAAPELQSLLARLAERLTAGTGAAAAAAEQQPQPQQAASRAALECLEEERQRLEAAAEGQRRRNAASAQRAEECYARAGEQHAAVGSAVQALADCLGPLAADEPGALPLLCVAVPDEVAGGGTALLQSLAALVGCDAGPAGAAHSEPAHEQSQRRQQEEEFTRLQAALQLTASAKVQAQAGVARCQAELGALQQAQEKQAHGSGAPGGMALLGRSVDDLEREVQHLQRKLEASLERCQSAAAQASLRHAAAAVAAQRASRVERTRARCVAKQQAVDLLVRHLARQLLAAELVQQERSTLGQMQALVQAALEDGEAVLAAAQQQREQLYAGGQLAGAAGAREQPPPSQEQGRPSPELLQALAAALGGSGSASSSGGGSGADPPAAVAQQLLQLRARLRQLSAQVQRELLPGQRAVFAQLHKLAFLGADMSSPELTAPDVRAKLEAADAAATALQQAAMTALGEAQQRQQQAQRRALAEQVLLDFYLHPANLSKRAEQQRRALDA